MTRIARKHDGPFHASLTKTCDQVYSGVSWCKRVCHECKSAGAVINHFENSRRLRSQQSTLYDHSSVRFIYLWNIILMFTALAESAEESYSKFKTSLLY